MRNLKARILVAYTGGTIGMKKTPEGYRPAPGHLQALLERTPRFGAEDLPRCHIHQFDPLLDSSNMIPANWLEIARVIGQNYHRYDGFLVIHGTDTMAYTASALSFLLENLGKPVILTGSQIPLEETRNDAEANLLGALQLLNSHHDRLPGVFLYFDNTLFRGNRATKVSATALTAFASPNCPPVARLGTATDIDWHLVPQPPAAAFRAVDSGTATVAAFRLFPGLRAEYLTPLLEPPVQGLVLECFGAGNAPDANRPLMEALAQATRRGLVVVAVTQPLQGTADLDLYATGRALRQAGVVSGYDLTAEAALAKLFYLFAKGHGPEEVKRLMPEDLRGELTPPATRW